MKMSELIVLKLMLFSPLIILAIVFTDLGVGINFKSFDNICRILLTLCRPYRVCLLHLLCHVQYEILFVLLMFVFQSGYLLCVLINLFLYFSSHLFIHFTLFWCCLSGCNIKEFRIVLSCDFSILT